MPFLLDNARGRPDPTPIRGVALRALTQVGRVIRAVAAHTAEATAGPASDLRLTLERWGSPTPCRRWEGAGVGGVRWRLTACLLERAGRHYAYRLEGHAAGDERRLVMEAAGWPAPRFQRQRQGLGGVRVDVDELAALDGSIEGRGEIVGDYDTIDRWRQLRYDLSGFHPIDSPPGGGARALCYEQWVGLGGRLLLLAGADLVAPHPDGTLGPGRDGVPEESRLALGWQDGEGSTVTAALCGGSVGDRCLALGACWGSDGRLIHQTLQGGSVGEDRAAECPTPPLDVLRPPTLQDILAHGPTLYDPGPAP